MLKRALGPGASFNLWPATYQKNQYKMSEKADPAVTRLRETESNYCEKTLLPILGINPLQKISIGAKKRVNR